MIQAQLLRSDGNNGPAWPVQHVVEQARAEAMNDENAPYHAHIYYTAETRTEAEAVRLRFNQMMTSGEAPQLLFIGQLKDRKAGPHPIPQFEIHYTKEVLPAVLAMIERSGLTALVHPLTDDDMADHTSLAHWIGTPIELDLSTLDPPGRNQGVARFGKSDF
jgi:aromatic ring-cleaving dioxygenase